jgi:hypothetical protein
MLLLLALACAHRGAGRLADTADPAGHLDTADSGASADSGGPADTGDAHDPCGVWAGVARVGTTWTYAPTDPYVERWGFDGTYTVEIASADGGTFTLAESGSYSGSSGEFAWTRTEIWRCDADGAWLLRSDASSHAVSGDNVFDTSGWRTFEPGWRVRPATAADWTDAFTLTASMNGASPVSSAVTCTTSVTTAAPWEGAGGPVAAIAVTPTCVGVGADPYTLGADVGLVGNADESLVGYTP